MVNSAQTLESHEITKMAALKEAHEEPQSTPYEGQGEI
jgi:hypothetical protein